MDRRSGADKSGLWNTSTCLAVFFCCLTHVRPPFAFTGCILIPSALSGAAGEGINNCSMRDKHNCTLTTYNYGKWTSLPLAPPDYICQQYSLITTPYPPSPSPPLSGTCSNQEVDKKNTTTLPFYFCYRSLLPQRPRRGRNCICLKGKH